MSKRFTWDELKDDPEFMAAAAEAVRLGMQRAEDETGRPITDAPMFRFTRGYTGEFWNVPKDEPSAA